MRVQARSVSPGRYPAASSSSRRLGASSVAASVIRRCPSTPTGSAAGTRGALPGHQITTGVSGTSSGATTDSTCSFSSPCMRSSSIWPGIFSPTMISASSRRCLRPPRPIKPRTWHGCSLPACIAARVASYWSASSVMMTRLSTTPVVKPPICWHIRVSSFLTVLAVVSISSIFIARLLEPPPGPAVPRHHGIGAGRSRETCGVCLRAAAGRPELLDRVQYLPGQLDLLMPGEQRRVADEHVEQQPLVGFRARLGERLAVGEVHVDVPDLHRRTRHLRPEPQRNALVRLDPDHQRVLAELLGVGCIER